MDFLELASQLRKPTGENGIQVGVTMNKGNHFMNSIVFKNIDLQDNETVLEIGFGNGKLIPELLNGKSNVRYEGVDYSELMVKEAQINNADLVKANIVNIQQGDFCNLPFSDNTFDKACTINTIYFLDDVTLGLKELYRVLKKGGIVSIGARPPETLDDLPFTKNGFKFYSGDQIVQLLESVGFVDCNYEVYQDLHAVLVDGKEIKLKCMCISGKK